MARPMITLEEVDSVPLYGSDVWGGGSLPTTSPLPYSNMEQFGAIWRTENILGSHYANEESQYIDPTWNPAEYLDSLGIEDDDEWVDEWQILYNTKSRAQYESRKANLRQQQYDRKVASTAGTLEGLAYGFAAGVADPITLTSMIFLTPALVVPGRIGMSALRVGAMGAGEIGVQEGILQSQQTYRTRQETIMNVAGGFALAGILGGATSPFMRATLDPGATEKLISDTLRTIPEGDTPRANGEGISWDAAGPVELNSARDIAELNARNIATTLEGATGARFFQMNRMNDIMAAALSYTPLGRRFAENVQSIDGLTPADVAGTSNRSVAPAGPAIERFRNEFTRRMHDFQLKSFKAWADAKGKGSVDQFVNSQITDTDLLTANAQMGELMLRYDGTEESLMNLRLSDGSYGDFKWAKESLDELNEIVEQYQFQLYIKGAFMDDFQELAFGSRTMSVENAKAKIGEMVQKRLETAGQDAEALQDVAKVRGKEDQTFDRLDQTLEDEIVRQDSKVQKSILEREELLERELSEMRLRHERELADLDAKHATANQKKPRREGGSTSSEALTLRTQRQATARQKKIITQQKQIESREKAIREKNAKAIIKKTKDDQKARKKNADNREKALQRRMREDEQAVAKIQKRKAEEAAQASKLQEGIEMMEKVMSKDYQYAKTLMQKFHGENVYRPQIYNRQAIMDEGVDQFIQDAIPARISWIQKQIDRGGLSEDELVSLTRQKEKLEKGWKDADNYKTYSEIYNHLLDETAHANNFQSVSSAANLNRKASALKKRALKWDQTMMAKYLENDVQQLFGNHFATVIPEVELRARGLWNKEDLEAAFAEVKKEYEIMRDDIRMDMSLSDRKRSKKIKKLDNDERRYKKAIQNMLQTMRNDDYADVANWHKEVVFWVNAINGMRTLGGVLPASLSDVPFAIAKVGGKHMSRSMQAFAGDFEKALAGLSKEEIGKILGVFEYGNFSTVSKITQSDEFGINQSAASRFLGRVQNGFYKATGIIKWNQVVKEMASFGATDRILDGALGRYTFTENDRMWLYRDGWTDERLAEVKKLYEMKGSDGVAYGVELSEGGLKVLDHARIRKDAMNNPELLDALNLSDALATSMNRVADRAVVTPGAGDLPDFVKHGPYMKLLTSLKSFGLASLNKTTMPLVGAVKNGDAGFASWAVAASFIGTGSYMARQWFYDIPVSENPQTLFWEGFNRSGMLGLYNQGITITQMMTNNFFGLGENIGLEVPSRYYARGALTDILGPTAGLIESGAGVANVYSKALSGDDVSSKEYMKAMRILPFNNLFYLRAALERM